MSTENALTVNSAEDESNLSLILILPIFNLVIP